MSSRRSLMAAVANFALIVVFPTWQVAVRLGWIMVCFAALSLLAVAFVRQFLPETKSRSVSRLIGSNGARPAQSRTAGAFSRGKLPPARPWC